MKNLMDLSVTVPTNRPLSDVQNALSNIRGVAASIGADVIISDNRGDPTKSTSLSKEFGASYHISSEPEAAGNFAYALEKVSTRFTWSLHDDDWIVDLGGAIPKQVPEGFVALCPIVILSSPATGIYAIRNFDLCHDDPLTRLRAYESQSGGANSLIFALWETELYRNIMSVATLHPCPAGYQDWTMAQAMLAEGKVMSVDKFGYRYNNNNWFGPPASIRAEIESLMRRAQLPPQLADHMMPLRLIDSVCFFGRRNGYRLSLSLRYEILNGILGDLITNYKADQLSDYVNHSLDVIRKIDHETGNRYQTYVEQALGGNGVEHAL